MNIKRCLSSFLLVVLIATSVHSQDSLESQITELARQLNLWRITQGLGPLVYNPTLERMALSQADYLLRLPSLPADIHAGSEGENPRQRSQLSQFAWPTYGHPELISVTEIAAIGSIKSALDFWHNSDIHNRSVTNPAYREVGIAAYPYGTDTMFIVVLGGRPDFLPVLIDLENNQLHLTTEKAEWQGTWIGNVVDYRFLDVDRQPITDWLGWERMIDISEELIAEAIFLQYRDLDEKRTQYEMIFEPKWSSIALPEGVIAATAIPTTMITPADAISTDTPESITSSLFSTNTPIPTATILPSPAPTLTPFPTFTPTSTPLPKSILLFYNEDQFVLYNAGSDFVDLSDSYFQGGDVSFVGRFWEEVVEGLNISALSPTHCLMIQPETELIYDAPTECTVVRSIVLEPDPRYFWLVDFDVSIKGEVITTCESEADSCEIIFP